MRRRGIKWEPTAEWMSSPYKTFTPRYALTYATTLLSMSLGMGRGAVIVEQRI